jgi:hypothetical protein
MASKSDGSANTRSVTALRISRSLLGSLVASRSMIPIPRIVRYLDIDMSSAPPIDGAVLATEAFGATGTAASRSPVGGGRGAP